MHQPGHQLRANIEEEEEEEEEEKAERERERPTLWCIPGSSLLVFAIS